MPDHRLVQCFGVKRRPGKEAKLCRRRFMWTARGASGNFGRKGVQACPFCGTLPDFQHPYNQYLGGAMTEDEAKLAMPEYVENWKKKNNS